MNPSFSTWPPGRLAEGRGASDVERPAASISTRCDAIVAAAQGQGVALLARDRGRRSRIGTPVARSRSACALRSAITFCAPGEAETRGSRRCGTFWSRKPRFGGLTSFAHACPPLAQRLQGGAVDVQAHTLAFSSPPFVLVPPDEARGLVARDVATVRRIVRPGPTKSSQS